MGRILHVREPHSMKFQSSSPYESRHLHFHLCTLYFAMILFPGKLKPKDLFHGIQGSLFIYATISSSHLKAIVEAFYSYPSAKGKEEEEEERTEICFFGKGKKKAETQK